MLYVGCHLSASAGNLAMVKTAESIGANTFAFFTRNPRGSKAKPEDLVDCEKAVKALQEAKFGPLVAHGAYTMNLCTAEAGAWQLCRETTIIFIRVAMLVRVQIRVLLKSVML